MSRAPAGAGAPDAKDEILQAAAELFMAYGYAATSIDAVAERLGATKGRIYHHWKSKADLYFDVQVAAMTRITAAVEPIARGPGSPAERLAAMALAHARILLTELPVQKVAVQGLERELLGSAGRGRSAASKRLQAVLRLRDDYERLFAEVIDAGIRDGVFIDLPPRLATKPFFGVMNWATVWYSPRRLQSADDVEGLARTLADYALRGLCRPPAGTEST